VVLRRLRLRHESLAPSVLQWHIHDHIR
jgi:hypothetical protein